MTETKLDTKSNPASLMITGDLTFGSVNDIHTALLDACSSTETLCISLDGVSSIDAAGLQLLFAACRFAEKHGKAVSIEAGAAVERLTRILEFTGLTPPSCMQGSSAK